MMGRWAYDGTNLLSVLSGIMDENTVELLGA